MLPEVLLSINVYCVVGGRVNKHDGGRLVQGKLTLRAWKVRPLFSRVPIFLHRHEHAYNTINAPRCIATAPVRE